MTRRDNPFDDWDWLGIFEHDTRPAEGCLRFLPKLVLLFLVLLVFVAPVWTTYYLGRGGLVKKPCLLLAVSLPLTLLVYLLNTIAVGVGVLHLATVAFSTSARHNPLITAAMFLASFMLLVLLIAFLAGQHDLRQARRWQRTTGQAALKRSLPPFRRDSFKTQPHRR